MVRQAGFFQQCVECYLHVYILYCPEGAEMIGRTHTKEKDIYGNVHTEEVRSRRSL